MVKVLKIKADVNKCQWIMPDDPQYTKDGHILFDGTSRIDVWSPPKFYVHDTTIEKSNFYVVSPGVFAFDENVMNHSMMAMFFEMAGEILPLELETGEKLYILNTTEVVNALDQENSVFRKNPRTGKNVRLITPVFKPHRLPESSIFKIPETRRAELLTYTGRCANPLDEFYANYLESGFTGLSFEEIWSES